MEQFVFEALI